MKFIEKQISAISEITHGIYISDYKTAGKESKLKKMGICHLNDCHNQGVQFSLGLQEALPKKIAVASLESV